uniref:Uncharacterized protein n=1 Tax=Oreochromis aureus TaxID=47969 RepID=A0AAZ1X9N7_OREAU
VSFYSACHFTFPIFSLKLLLFCSIIHPHYCFPVSLYCVDALSIHTIEFLFLFILYYYYCVDALSIHTIEFLFLFILYCVDALGIHTIEFLFLFILYYSTLLLLCGCWRHPHY